MCPQGSSWGGPPRLGAGTFLAAGGTGEFAGATGAGTFRSPGTGAPAFSDAARYDGTAELP